MRIRVRIPTPLRSYTQGAPEVEVEVEAEVEVEVLAQLPDTGVTTLLSVVDALDAAYPGIKFRVIDEQTQIRAHIKLFVAARMENNLRAPVAAGEIVDLICSLSGG